MEQNGKFFDFDEDPIEDIDPVRAGDEVAYYIN